MPGEKRTSSYFFSRALALTCLLYLSSLRASLTNKIMTFVWQYKNNTTEKDIKSISNEAKQTEWKTKDGSLNISKKLIAKKIWKSS